MFDIRKLFGEKRAGHLGTLDPGAAGVLPVCLGRAAQLFDLLVDKEKTYRFVCLFGKATDTQDSYGTVTAERDMHVTADALEAVLPRFTGSIQQKAPAYSALKSNGQKLYDLALAGKEIPEKIRSIFIRSLKVIEQRGENAFLMEVTCSRGTYVRTLCHDIGISLGGYAHMGLLIRTAAGPFSIDRCVTMEELHEKALCGSLKEVLIEPEQALLSFPAVTLPGDRLKPMLNGLSSYIGKKLSSPVRLYCGDTFMGMAEESNGQLKLKIHLYPIEH